MCLHCLQDKTGISNNDIFSLVREKDKICSRFGDLRRVCDKLRLCIKGLHEVIISLLISHTRKE